MKFVPRLSHIVYNEAQLRFAQRVYDLDYTISKDVYWSANTEAIDILKLPGKLLLSDKNAGTGGGVILLELPQGLAKISFAASTISFTGASNSESQIQEMVDLIKEVIPEKPEPEDDDIRVKFWYLTQSGPSSVTREISAPTWEAVKDNYSNSTFEGLDNLIRGFTPDENSGKIILWHGLPGTGKTYALRALVREWKKWLNAEYILDPESLFGYSAGYLAQMIFGNEYDEPISIDESGNVHENIEKWKLLILEDTGELLAEDAKSRTGQGLSRLLNLADGFIGQGLKTLVLITTNEELDKLHPAVSREGRCAAAIHFNELSVSDAREWAKKNDLTLPNRTTAWTLADLYALRSNAKIEVVARQPNKVGFQRAS